MPKPPIPEEDRRNVVQSIRFKESEWKTVEDRAQKAGRLPRVYVRERALGIDGKPKKRKPKSAELANAAGKA